MINNIEDLFDELSWEYEKFKNGEKNEYDKIYKKVRIWAKLYKGGNYPKTPIDVLDSIIKKIADDEDILEEILDTIYDLGEIKDLEEYTDKLDNLSKKLGLDELSDIIKDFKNKTDF